MSFDTDHFSLLHMKFTVKKLKLLSRLIKKDNILVFKIKFWNRYTNHLNQCYLVPNCSYVYILHFAYNGTHFNVFIMYNGNIFVFNVMYIFDFLFCIYCIHSSLVCICYTVALEEQSFTPLYVLHILWTVWQ